jgi:hypothetical protein
VISRWKNDFVTPDQSLHQATHEGELAAAKVYRVYQDTLFAYQAMDFDDLIRLPVELFEKHAAVLEKWQNKLRYLLLDEYQDTNTCQYQLVKLLTGSKGMFTAVGDDDQSIYAWRGANMENLRLLQEDFPKLKVIKLEQNYRSVSRILRAANSVIANNPKLFEKAIVERPRRWRSNPDRCLQRRRTRSRKRGDAAAGAQVRKPHHLCRLRHPLSRQPSGTGDGAATAQSQNPLRDEWRPVIFRQDGNQGSDQLPAAGGQRGRRPGLHPRHHHPQTRHWQHHPGKTRHLFRRAPHLAVCRRIRNRAGNAVAGQATGAAARLLQIHPPPAIPRPARTRRPADARTTAGNRLRNLALRQRRNPRRRKQMEKTCSTSSAGSAKKAKKTAKT